MCIVICQLMSILCIYILQVWVGNTVSDIIWRDDDGTIWHPTAMEYTDHNGGKDTLIVRWVGQEPSRFDAFNESSGIFFDYTTDCDNELAKEEQLGILFSKYFLTPNF